MHRITGTGLTKVNNSKWGSSGLLNWDVVAYPSDAPHQVQCTLRWNKVDDFDAAAAGPAAAEVFGDIKNYTTGTPVVLKGIEKGKWSA